MIGETIPLDLAPASKGRLGITRRFPVGPVLGISPFNFPLNLAAHKVAPAIAAGCSIVLKPPSADPLIMLKVAEIATEAGLPAGASASFRRRVTSRTGSSRTSASASCRSPAHRLSAGR